MSLKKFLCNATAIIVVALGAASPNASAQAGDVDVGEFSGFGGGFFGAGAHGTVGGSAGIAFSRYAMAFIDTTYMPLGQNTIQPWPAKSTVSQSHLYDFAVDFHFRVPVKERWAPYAIMGAPLLLNSLRQDTVDARGNPVTYNYKQLNGGFHTGAGLRYYVGNNWGIRPEVKVIVSRQTYVLFTIGVFWVTPASW
jgi:hypothetical protein